MSDDTPKHRSEAVLFDKTDSRYAAVYDFVFFDLGYSQKSLRAKAADRAAAISNERLHALQQFTDFMEERNRSMIEAAIAACGEITTLKTDLRSALLSALDAFSETLDILRSVERKWNAKSRKLYWKGNDCRGTRLCTIENLTTNFEDENFYGCVKLLIKRAHDMVTWLMPKADTVGCEPTAMRALIACRHLYNKSEDFSLADIETLRQFITSLEILHEREGHELSKPPLSTPQSLASQNERDAKYLPNENIFRRNGTHWEIVYLGQKIATSSDRVGFQYIAELIRRPQKAVSVEDLSAIAHGKPAAEKSEYSTMNSKELQSKGMHAHKCPDAPTRRKGKGGLVEVIQETEKELADARSSGAIAKVNELEEYLKKLHKDMKSHRSSLASDDGAPIQRLRKAVSKAIWDAVKDFKTDAPKLYQHFKAAINTGFKCDYSPTPETTWLLQ